jgi:hypothetical protein
MLSENPVKYRVEVGAHKQKKCRVADLEKVFRRRTPFVFV